MSFQDKWIFELNFSLLWLQKIYRTIPYVRPPLPLSVTALPTSEARPVGHLEQQKKGNWLFHLALLVLLSAAATNTTPAERNIYCWRQRHASDSIRYTSLVYCKNMDVKKGDILRLKNQTLASESIDEVSFISITGHIDETALDLFPEVKQVYVMRSYIKGIALKNKIDYLMILNSCFPKVTRETMNGVKQITSLLFLANPGLEFEERAFTDLKKLKRLVIINQNIPQLHRSFLEGPTNMDGIIIFSSNLTRVDEDAFLSQPYLEAIWLDDNPLESFKINISELPNLFLLSLVNTNLKEIMFDASLLYILTLPTNVLLHNFNASLIKSSFPELRAILIPQEDWENPDLKPIKEMLQRSRVLLVDFPPRNLNKGGYWRERDLYRLSKC